MKCSHSGLLMIPKFPDGRYRAFCTGCLLTGPYESTRDYAEYSFWYREFGRTLGSVGFKEPEKLVKADIRDQAYKSFTQYLTFDEIRKRYPMAILPNPTPYWIIVSDEGHAAIPAKHLTKEAADAEAKRLTATRPGVNFTVFEAKYSLKTPKAEAVKTVFEPTPKYYIWGRDYSYWPDYPNTATAAGFFAR